MPTISRFEETKGILPEAPAATDVNPERFGRDSAAMAQIGGQIGEFGSRLMQVRKRAMESDAIASAQSDATLKISAMEDEERMGFQSQVAADGSVVSPHGSMADSIKGKMEGLIQEHLKGMPTSDAQAEYRQRMQPYLDKTYLQNLDWENKERAKSYLGNIQKRSNLATQDIYKKPSLLSTMNHLEGLRQDINAKAGTVLERGDAEKVYQATAKEYAGAMFGGLADSGRPEDIQKGRQLLKDLPPQLAEVLDDKDIRTIEKGFDAAEKVAKQQLEIDLQVEKRAQIERNNVAKNETLTSIYEGKATVRGILKNPNLDAEDKQRMIGILDARSKESEIPDPRNLRDVAKRMTLPPEDPDYIGNENQVMDLYVNGKLTWDQKTKALNELKRANSSEGQVEVEQRKLLFKRSEEILVRDNMDKDAIENHAKFFSQALQELDAAKNDPKATAELLDPNSSKSLWKKINNFKKTPQQALNANAERVRAQSLQRQGITKIEQPKGTVRVLNPSGKAGFVPEKDLAGFISRGYKLAPAEGKKKSNRSPSSVGGPEEFDAAGTLEQFYGAYDNEEQMVDAIARNKEYSSEETKQILKEVMVDVSQNYYELSQRENDRLASKINEEIRLIDSPKNEGKATGKIPELRTRKATKSDIESLKKNPGKW